MLNSESLGRHQIGNGGVPVEAPIKCELFGVEQALDVAELLKLLVHIGDLSFMRPTVRHVAKYDIIRKYRFRWFHVKKLLFG